MASAVWGQPEERCHGAAVRSWWDAQCRPRTRARCCLRRHAQTDRRTGRGPSNAQLSGAGTPVVPPGAGGTHWVLWVERPHRERRPDLRRPCGAHRPGRRRRPYSSCRRRRGAAGQHSRTAVASSPRRAGRVLDGGGHRRVAGCCPPHRNQQRLDASCDRDARRSCGGCSRRRTCRVASNNSAREGDGL